MMPWMDAMASAEKRPATSTAIMWAVRMAKVLWPPSTPGQKRTPKKLMAARKMARKMASALALAASKARRRIGIGVRIWWSRASRKRASHSNTMTNPMTIIE